MASGLTTVCPCPKVAAANSVGVAPSDTLPLNDSTPSSHSPPRPSAAAADLSPSAPSFGARLTKAVLQDSAKSVRNDTRPRAMSWALVNFRPSTSLVRGQSTTVSGVTAFFCSRPRVETILKVEPGGT